MNELWTTGHIVELNEMLKGRETRAALQRQILEFCSASSLICFTLNIAGPVKVSALISEAFYAGCAAIEEALKMAGLPAESRIEEYPYGYEAYYVISEEEQSAEDIKRLMCIIEEEHELGRLFDIDVIRSDGSKVSRTELGMEERRCLICEKAAAICARARAHTVSELQSRTAEMITDYLRENISLETVSRMSYISMMNEVAVTPKPGLVDLANNGSHRDMTPDLFEKSAAAIKDYFGKCFECGRRLADTAPEEIITHIRPLGVEAEKKMYETTGGVNTHKGAIFSLGIICAAWGCAGGFDVKKIMETSGRIASPIADEKGLRGIAGGARTQAASGFESVEKLSLPAYKLATLLGFDVNTAAVYALIKLIAGITDTNMIARGGHETAAEMKASADDVAKHFETGMKEMRRPGGGDMDYIITRTGEDFMKDVSALDEAFIAKNVSPGGSADLLMITLFFIMIEGLGK